MLKDIINFSGRSLGVTILGVWLCIVGVEKLILSSGSSDLSTGALLLLFGISVLQLKEWARRFTIYWHVLTAFLGAYCVFAPMVYPKGVSSLSTTELNKFELTGGWSLLVSFVVIYFLTLPGIKKQFLQDEAA